MAAFVVEITAEISEFESAMGSASSASAASADKIGSSFSNAEKLVKESIGRITDAIGTLIPKFVGAGMTANSAGESVAAAFDKLTGLKLGPLVEATNQMKDFVLETRNAAAATKQSVPDFLEVKDAMEEYGVPTEHVKDSLQHLSEQMRAAASGSSDAQKAFEAAGISTDGWNQKLPPLNSVLVQLAGHLKEGKDPLEANSNATKLLGDHARDMLPWLSQGSAAIAQQTHAHTEHAQAVVNSQSAFEGLQKTEAKLSQAMQTLLLPIFSALAETLDKVFQYVIALIDGIKEFGKVSDSATTIAVHGFQALGKVIVDVLQGNWAKAVQDAKDALEQIKRETLKAIDDLQSAPQGAADKADGNGPPTNNQTRHTGAASKQASDPSEIVSLQANQRRIEDTHETDQQVIDSSKVTYDAVLAGQAQFEKQQLAELTSSLARESALEVSSNKATDQQVEANERGSTTRRSLNFAQFFKGVSSAFESFARSVISGSETIGQAWNKLVSQMTSQFVQALENQLKSFIQHKFMEVGVHASAEATKDQASKAAHAKEDTRTAYSAAKAAWESIVHTPVVGPVLAPIAAAATFAAVSAFGSAEGGQYLVPSEQLTMLHRNEMVLPAGVADRMRGVIEGGGGGGVTVVVNHSVSAIDAESFQSHIRRHGNLIGNEVSRVLKRKGISK